MYPFYQACIDYTPRLDRSHRTGTWWCVRDIYGMRIIWDVTEAVAQFHADRLNRSS